MKKHQKKNVKTIESYNTLKNLNFIEVPDLGLKELKKIVKKNTYHLIFI